MVGKYVDRPVEAELEELDSDFIESVDERHADNTFPLIIPEQQDVISVADAENLLAWVQEDEHIKIQSFMESEYANHRQNCALDDDTTESLVRARWARTSYYPFLQKYREKVTHTMALPEALQSLLCESSLTDLELKTFTDMLDESCIGQNVSVELILDYVEQRWQMYREKHCSSTVRRFIDSGKKDLKTPWLKRQLTEFAQDFIAGLKLECSSAPSTKFVPELLPSHFEDSQKRAWAETLLASLPMNLHDKVKSSTAEAFRKECELNPEFVDEKDFRKYFLEDFYYQNLEQLLSKPVTSYSFVPALPLSSMKDEKLRIIVQQLLDNMDAKKEATFKERLDERMKHDLAWAASRNMQQLSDLWMMQNYFQLLAKFLEADSPKRRPQAEGSSNTNTQIPDTTMSMLASPKRARLVHALDQEDMSQKPPTPIILHEVHTNMAPLGNSTKTLEACVLYFPDAVRHVNVPIKNSQEKERVPVYTVLLGDLTAPCSFDAWRDVAQRLHTLLLSTRDEQTSETIYIRIADFDIASETRKHLTPMKKLVSNTKTTFSLIANPEASNMIGGSRPAVQVLTSDFSLLQKPLPFSVSLMGVVGEVGEPYESSNGNLLQKIRVQDGHGKAIHILAFDRQVRHPCFQVGNRLYLYFLTASAGTNGRSGSLWLFNESHVVCAHTNCHVEAVQQEISL